MIRIHFTDVEAVAVLTAIQASIHSLDETPKKDRDRDFDILFAAFGTALQELEVEMQERIECLQLGAL